MAALDFPNSPSVGQLFPSPAIAGVPQYKWDGTVWTMASAFTNFVPSGTVMLFYQATAPLGWTQVTTQNDKALRVVSGTGGVSGGTNPFSTVQAQTVVGNHTLVASEEANLNVSVSGTVTVYPGGSGTFVHDYFGPSGQYTSWNNATGTTGEWDVAGTSSGYGIGVDSTANTLTGATSSGGGGAHNHPITMQVQYIDVIIASMN